MLTQLITSPTVHSAHDSGVRQVAALSARLAYALMCLTLVWGIFTATGWVAKLTGRQAVRSSHMIMATFTLAFGGLHAACFLFLTDSDEIFSWVNLVIPVVDGGQHVLHGIVKVQSALRRCNHQSRDIDVEAKCRRLLRERLSTIR
jgi:sulfoxide reductase heme-binding subunit YedZ